MCPSDAAHDDMKHGENPEAVCCRWPFFSPSHNNLENYIFMMPESLIADRIVLDATSVLYFFFL